MVIKINLNTTKYTRRTRTPKRKTAKVQNVAKVKAVWQSLVNMVQLTNHGTVSQNTVKVRTCTNRRQDTMI